MMYFVCQIFLELLLDLHSFFSFVIWFMENQSRELESKYTRKYLNSEISQSVDHRFRVHIWLWMWCGGRAFAFLLPIKYAFIVWYDIILIYLFSFLFSHSFFPVCVFSSQRIQIINHWVCWHSHQQSMMMGSICRVVQRILISKTVQSKINGSWWFIVSRRNIFILLLLMLLLLSVIGYRHQFMKYYHCCRRFFSATLINRNTWYKYVCTMYEI